MRLMLTVFSLLGMLGAGASYAGAPEVAPGFDLLTAMTPAIHWDGKFGPDDLGVPREIGCGIVNVRMTRDPVFTFVVKERIHAALSLDGKPRDPRGVAIFMPGNKVKCVRSEDNLLVRDWEPGTYTVHVSTYCLFPNGGDCVAPDWAAGAYKLSLVDLTPRALTLADDFTPNPLRVEGLRRDRLTRERPETTSKCYHDAVQTTEAPALEVTLTHAWPHLRIWAEQGVRDLLVTDANGQQHCSDSGAGGEEKRAFVDLQQVPAGKLQVRVLGRDGGRRSDDARRSQGQVDTGRIAQFGLSIEDWSRPRDRVWMAASLPTFALTKGIAQPMVVVSSEGPVLPAPGVGFTCGEQLFGDMPVAFLDVTRPLDELWLRIVSDGPTGLVLEGPLGPDRRETQDYKAKCYATEPGDSHKLARLEIGRYAVYAGRAKGAPSSPFAFIFGDATTALDPLVVTLPPAANLPVTGRLLTSFYGLLPSERWSSELKQSLFLAATDGLFVYPRFDLDEATAVIVKDADGAARVERAKDLAWPKKDEPMLVQGIARRGQSDETLVLIAADAAVYRVATKYIADAPSGPVTVPPAARNVKLEWDDAVKLATKAEAKDIQAYNTANDRAAACEERYLDARGPQYRLAERTAGGSVRVTAVHSDATLDAAYAKCGFPGVEALQDKLLKKLEASYRARLAAGLAKIAARFGRTSSK